VSKAPEKPLLSPMGQAALFYARRGWPVFPCREHDGEPYRNAKGEMVTPMAKSPYIKGGVDRSPGKGNATTDERQIAEWWRRWPNALIGLPMGENGLFALDFDPRKDERVDEATGEVTIVEFTLEQQKADTEAQIGCELPISLAVRTPSGGVHVYYRQPDDGGEPLRNRGVLPEHVDTRGQGGYVIAPPSKIVEPCVNATAGDYRFLRGDRNAEAVEPPAELVAVLRAPKPAKAKAPAPLEHSRIRPGSTAARPLDLDDAAAEDVRKYALAGLEAECRAVRQAGSGRRNAQLNESALKIASLVAAGALDAGVARYSLEAAARENPGRDDDGQLVATIESGWSAGLNNPRDLAEIAAAARARADRRRSRFGYDSSYSIANADRDARPPRAAAPPPRAPGPVAGDFEPFRDGRMEGNPSVAEGPGDGAGDPMEALGEVDRARLKRIAEAWLKARLERLAEVPRGERKKALTAAAWGIGRRAAAGLVDELAAKEAIWPLCDDVLDILQGDIDRAIDDGFNRGFDPAPALLDLRCAMRPMTDFGLAERFLERHGDRFRFTTAKGWLGWDERRWKVLDQDEKTLPAELIAAVFETIRDVQREARRVAETGLKLELVDKGKQQELALDEPNPHALDHWVAVGRGWKRFSTLLAAWGRQCEQAAKPGSIANLARGVPRNGTDWLTLPFERFDHDRMAINVLNGTLRIGVEELPDGTKAASVKLDRHKREDLLTRVAAVEYDAEAACPLYDAMIAWAQPEPAMRRYLHQAGGYACTGDTTERRLWFHWGGGRNGKSTTIDSWCSSLGDYSGTIGIESFLDQGIKKRGDQASPDLAKLSGIRLLRASEPDGDSKLSVGLIKGVTGGEPMSVRALHRGFFDLLPSFKLHASGNKKPEIPHGGDDGIWGRMKLIPWLRHIEKPEEDPFKGSNAIEHPPWPAKDLKLLDKIKAGELAGVFRRLVEGLCDYLVNGFVEPERVTEATAAYRDQSDPMARFLRLCTVRDPAAKVKSSELLAVHEAVAKREGGQAWKPPGFAKAMFAKGFDKTRSDGMRWVGLKLVHDDHPRRRQGDAERAPAREPVRPGRGGCGGRRGGPWRAAFCGG
jgi:putative DNA primase/helicase